MTRSVGRGGGLRFAAGVAAAGVVALVALEPWLGAWRARAVFALVLLPFAGARHAQSLGALARSSIALSLASLALGWAGLRWPLLAMPLAGAFGVTRALCAPGRNPARALGTEVVLIGAGLALAALCDGRSSLSFGLGLWAFFLVQAAFPLTGGAPVSSESGDPFERARDRALELLARRPS